MELALALAVGTVILSGSVLAIYNVLVGSTRANNQVTALTDLNRAALSIKNDLVMTQTANVTGSTANLTWDDYTTSFGSSGFTYHSATYKLSGKQLLRTSENGTISIVGRNISSLNFSQTGQLVVVTISSGNVSQLSGVETIKFSTHMRSQVIQ